MRSMMSSDNALPSRSFCLLLAFLCLFASGCSLVKLKEEVEAVKSSTILIGHVFSRSPVDGPVIVVAYDAEAADRHVEHFTVLHASGEYELMVKEGVYYVFAFNDANGNLVYDEGEAAGQYGAPQVVAAPAGGVVPNIEIVIGKESGSLDWPIGGKVDDPRKGRLHSRLAGSIVSLDDEIFLDEHGAQGFWEPVSFYKTYGGSIYFLEDYNPDKIPILFIHGAGGTPRGWRFFVENIDRARFQPWFFYYPSGARMRSMSHLLLWKLQNLQIKYKFKELYFVAHSMGGLIARSFVMDFGSEFPYVNLFVSLATPWGGDKMAEYGVKQSPAVIPCWLDMQPEGGFIQALYRERMPDSLGFYIFYGHEGNRNPFRSNNDGTITLASLLDRRAQKEADMIYAFNEDHASIINSEEVVDQFNAIINSYASEHAEGTAVPGGYIKLHFTYDFQGEGGKPWPFLVLRNKEKNKSVTTIALRPDDNGKKLGPFPQGSYSARLISDGFKTTNPWAQVTVERTGINELAFTLIPDGTVGGYVTESLPPEDKVAGMPEWQLTPEQNTITLESVVLVGNGVKRRLEPYERDDFDWNDMEASRTDYSYKGLFRFFGVPAGRYELVIKAEGYETMRRTCSVIPGRKVSFEFYELVSSLEM